MWGPGEPGQLKAAAEARAGRQVGHEAMQEQQHYIQFNKDNAKGDKYINLVRINYIYSKAYFMK